MSLLVVLGMGASGAAQRHVFPPRLEQYFSSAGVLSPGERQRLLDGQPVTRLLDADAAQEVAVFGAVWIAAPASRYVEAMHDIERFETGGGFRMTKRIGTPPRLEDFAALRLTADDLNGLRRCRVGDCQVKLGGQALQRFRTEIDWNAPTADEAAHRLMRQLAFDYVTAYLKGGNDQLAVYRDNSRPTFVAREFRAMVEGMPALSSQMPELRRYLLEYPKVTLPDSTSFLYWQESEFGLKPTVRINHLTIRETPDGTAIASKMLYASHYFWTGLELRALVPDPQRGQGFWFVTVNRARADGLTGFAGGLVRRRVRGEVQAGTLDGLRRTKQKLEHPGRR